MLIPRHTISITLSVFLHGECRRKFFRERRVDTPHTKRGPEVDNQEVPDEVERPCKVCTRDDQHATWDRLLTQPVTIGSRTRASSEDGY